MSKARQLADLGNQVDDGAITGSNMVINGGMTVAQRGNVTGVTASGYHGPDRFKLNQSGRDQFQVSISQDSDGPDGYSNSWKLETTTAETAIDISEYVICQHRIEAQNLQHLNYGNSNAKQVTLSFWVKSSIAATYSVYLYAADGVAILGSTYTINTASTWEYKTITFAGYTSTAISHDNGAGVDIGFILAAGSSTKDTDNTSWSSYAIGKLAYGHTDAANAVMTTANATWQITGVCLNVGDSAIDFPHESYGDTLAKCQRYFEVIGESNKQFGVPSYPVNGLLYPVAYRGFQVKKRSAPTLSNIDLGYFNNGWVSSTPQLYAETLNGCLFSPHTITTSNLYLMRGSFSADAEL